MMKTWNAETRRCRVVVCNKIFLLLSFSAIFFSICASQQLTGNFHNDLLASLKSDSLVSEHHTTIDDSQLKHPLRSGLYSIVLPGAGQYTNGDNIKGAIFFVAEVAGVATAIIYANKGDSKTDEFQNYADAHWSAVRYAQWINKYGVGDYGPAANIAINPDASLQSWQRVNFESIRTWERGQHSTGFSHALPDHGEQQYYELIGKYNQFKFGWDTYPQDTQGVPISDGTKYDDMIPQQMKDYAVNRGKANNYYYISGVAAGLVVVNHVISALEAYLSAKSYNKTISTEMGMHIDEVGGLAVASTVKIHF